MRAVEFLSVPGAGQDALYVARPSYFFLYHSTIKTSRYNVLLCRRFLLQNQTKLFNRKTEMIQIQIHAPNTEIQGSKLQFIPETVAFCGS